MTQLHPDLLGFQARYQPGRTFAVDAESGRRWSFAALDDRVARFAAALAREGVVPGERVVCLARNSVELVALHLACSRAGAVFVPISWRLSAAEVAAQVDDADPALIVGDQEMERLGQTGLHMDELSDCASRLDPAPPLARDPDRASLILFTSGTAGRPKGAVLSERALAESAINFSLLGRVTHQSRFLCDAPMFHVIGLVANLHPALLRGGGIVVSDGFIAERTLARLADADLGITHYFCVPQMAALLRDQPGYDPALLGGLDALFTGGAPHAAASVQRWLDDGVIVADGYGMSEAGTVFCMPLEADVIRRHIGAVGLCTPRIRTRVVDAEGQVPPPEEPGELLLKGDNLFREYWRRLDETAAAFTDDGWFRTGDIVRADEDGFFWITDRLKDMFISGGENVYPVEIENALAEDLSIRECAVVGEPDSRWGEVGHLFVVPGPGATVDPERMLASLKTRIAGYKIPKKVTVLDALPRSGAGKVLKHALRELAEKERNALE